MQPTVANLLSFAGALMVLTAPDALAQPLFGAGAGAGAGVGAVSAAAADPKAAGSADAGAGLGTILKDHFQYVSDPASAEQPIPDGQNNAAREAHRQVHASLFEATGGGGAGKAAAAGVKPGTAAAA